MQFVKHGFTIYELLSPLAPRICNERTHAGQKRERPGGLPDQSSIPDIDFYISVDMKKNFGCGNGATQVEPETDVSLRKYQGIAHRSSTVDVAIALDRARAGDRAPRFNPGPRTDVYRM